MTEPVFVPKCDGPSCSEAVAFECGCSRCDRECDDEKFYACQRHQSEAAEKHLQIRGRTVSWWSRRSGS